MNTAPSHQKNTHRAAEHLFFRSAGALLREYNQIRYLKDSGENFPQWINALEQAQHHICIEMYIIGNDDFGWRIRQILAEKAQQGVHVLLIYDWFGCLNATWHGFFKPLKKAGVHLAAYNKPNLMSGIGILSRNHRKSIVVDGKVAFVSGLCMSSRWEGDIENNQEPWRDSGLMLQGEAVCDVQAAFIDTWHFLKQRLPETWVASETAVQGDVAVRVVATTPANANMMRLDLTAIGMARETIWLTDAYFMPSRIYTQALINAAQDGVDVRILVPRTSDIRWIGTVSRTQYRNLLEAGVRVFEWNGSMIHAKSAIVDGKWARVGSTNLNFSSWFANRELDIVLEGQNSVHALETQFLWDLSQSTEVVLDQQNTTQLRSKRKKAKPTFNTRTHAAARQLAYLSASIDNILRGNTTQISKPEMWAHASIAVATLLFAILLFFFPRLIAIPFAALLLAAAAVSTLHVYRLRRQLNEKTQTTEYIDKE